MDSKYLKIDICKFYELCVRRLSEDDFLKAVFCDEVLDIIFDFMNAQEKDWTVSCLIIIGEIVAIKGADIYIKYLT